jgi:hypothetical protein
MGKHNGQILASALPGSGLGRTSAQGDHEILPHLGRGHHGALLTIELEDAIIEDITAYIISYF